jgi:hypothetical protein
MHKIRIRVDDSRSTDAGESKPRALARAAVVSHGFVSAKVISEARSLFAALEYKMPEFYQCFISEQLYFHDDQAG